MPVRLVKAYGLILVRLLLPHTIAIVIVVVVSFLVSDAAVAVIVQIKLQVFSPIFTAKIILAAKLLLDLLQAALFVEKDGLDFHACGLGVSALLDQLLKLLNVRVFHFEGAMIELVTDMVCDFSNILMSNIYTNSIWNYKIAKKSL